MYFSVSRYPYYTVIFCDMINVRGCPRVPVRISTGERRPLGVSATRRGNNAHKRDKGPLSAHPEADRQPFLSSSSTFPFRAPERVSGLALSFGSRWSPKLSDMWRDIEV